ncbi:MAG: Fe-S cluster assembly protein SufD [bacterium]
MTTDLVKARETYLAALKPETQGPAWLGDLRAEAFTQFQRLGFPTTKDERWKYTDLSLYLPGEVKKNTQAPIPTGVLAKLKSHSYDVDKDIWLVFVDGIFSPEQSLLKPLSPGLEVGSLAVKLEDSKVQNLLGRVALSDQDAFAALNLSAFRDGFWIFVPEGQTLTETVHAVFLSTQPSPSWVRNLILAGANSRISVVEHFLEEAVGPSFASSVTEINVSAGAQVSHVKIQEESEQNLHLGQVKARQEAGSRLTSRVFSFGGKLIRNETETLLADRRASAVLDGLFMARNHQHVDNQTFIDHASAQCACEENYKGVLDGEAVGIFDGRVLVRENAQKTDARQSNKNLLMTKNAKVYSKPQLKIYADDVKCSHGSATGQLDEEALFYLRARGIGPQEARRILVAAFAGELVARLETDDLRRPLEKTFQRWLEACHAG